MYAYICTYLVYLESLTKRGQQYEFFKTNYTSGKYAYKLNQTFRKSRSSFFIKTPGGSLTL